MGNIKFLFKMLKKNKIKNILIIIQIVISVFFCTFFLMPITKSIEINTMVGEMKLKENIASLEEAEHISINLTNYNNDKYQNLKEYVKNIEGVKSVGTAYSLVGDITTPSTILYDKELCMNLKHPVQKGKWFDEEVFTQNEEIPVVISHKLQKKYPVNSTFEINLVACDTQSTIKLKCNVIGVLKNKAYIYLGGGNHSEQSLSDLFTKTKNQEFIILPNVFENQEEQPISFAYRGMLIEYSDFNKVASEIQERGIGKLYDFNSLKQNDINNIFTYNEQKIYEFIIVFIFILISISGYNTLANLEYKRLLVIYYITGMTWKKGIILITIRNFIIIMIPTIISSILSNLIISYLRTLYPFDEKNIFITIILYLSIFVVTTFITILNLRKQKPIEILREVD